MVQHEGPSEVLTKQESVGKLLFCCYDASSSKTSITGKDKHVCVTFEKDKKNPFFLCLVHVETCAHRVSY